MRKLVLLSIVATMMLIMFIGCATSDKMTKANTSPAGMFVAKMPSASGMGRIIVIHLFENGNALRSNIYIGEPSGDYIEEGTWSEKDGVINVLLKNTAEPPVDVALSFKYDSGGLTSIKYDETPMGKKEIRFTRVEKSF